MPVSTKQPDRTGLTRLEWSTAAVALVGGVAIALVGASYGLTNVTGVGAGFFPTVAGVLVAASGLLWLVQLEVARRVHVAPSDDLVEIVDEDSEEAEFPDRAGWARVGIIVASVLGAALLLPVTGYTVTMTAMLAVVLFFVSKRPWWLALLVGVGAAVVSRLVFESWLGTELPASSIDFIATLGL